MAFVMEKYGLGERHACGLTGLDRSTYRTSRSRTAICNCGPS